MAGNLYAIDRNFSSSLYTVDKSTGSNSFIGSTGVGLNSIAFGGSLTGTIPEPTTFLVWAGLACCGTLATKRRRVIRSLQFCMKPKKARQTGGPSFFGWRD